MPCCDLSVTLCATVPAVQHVEAVLTQSELCQSRRGPDGRLLCVMFPYNPTQQWPAESLSELCVADDVSLCTRQRAASHHHAGRACCWHIVGCDCHQMNVIWNYAFRRIFQCCWHESVSCLLYYCKVLSVSYVIYQRKLMFLKKICTFDSSVIRFFSVMCTHEYSKILSRYFINSPVWAPGL